MKYGLRVLISFVVVWISLPSSLADEKKRAEFFESQIRPLLIDRCQKCHSAKKSESGLRLDSIKGILAGGNSGPAIKTGHSKDSLLMKAIRHEGELKMPPRGRLSSQEIQALAKWIDDGAYWPIESKSPSVGPQIRFGGKISEEEKNFWSFQAVTDPKIPIVKNTSWILQPLDHFVLAPLEAEGLPPSALASPEVILRRVYFDLIGLPPTPQQTQAFLKEAEKDFQEAYSKLIDTLLDSPAYGERWARHWLDVVRYADTAGETADYPAPLAWKYRNWVIDAFNQDKPYDQFLREQIAGDILGQQLIEREGKGLLVSASPLKASSKKKELLEKYRSLIEATGFIAISRRFGFDVENYHYLTIQDTIDTIGQAVMGLTLGCARCHDHKYDPVNKEDYYAWYGIFESTRYSFPGSEEKKRPYDLFPDVPPGMASQLKSQYDKQLADLKAKVEAKQKEKDDLQAQLAGFVSGQQGFEFSGLGGVPDKPWMSHPTAKVTTEAQSPYENVFQNGNRGLEFPTGNDNTHFGIKILPAKTPKLTPYLYFNIDFRNIEKTKKVPGAYRFYLGRGPGYSAGVEMGATLNTFYIKDDATYKPVRKLLVGEWYNLQLNVDLRSKTYTGTLSSLSKKGVSDSSHFKAKFTRGWDGTIDQFFVDRYGPAGGETPARQFDNYRIDELPIPSIDRKRSPIQTGLVTWKAYLQKWKLPNSSTNTDNHKGYSAWRKQPLPIVGVNLGKEDLKIPGTVKPGALVVHPNPRTGVGMVWRAPQAGTFKVSGRVEDAHHCGDSVLWHLDHLSFEKWSSLAEGDVKVEGSSTIRKGDGKELIVELQAGDYLQLSILPKAHYGCDLTQVDLEIEELDSEKKRKWSLRSLANAEFTSGNPLKDSYGHEDSWTFIEVPMDRGQSVARLKKQSLTTDRTKLFNQSQKLGREVQELKDQQTTLMNRRPYQDVYGAIEKAKPADSKVHLRGDYKNLGATVPRRNLTIFGGNSIGDPDKDSGRLDLANWLTRPDHPLVSRVMVNRIWQHHLGRALVETPNDFGLRGQRPSHPQLLDFLATRFIQDGWSIKALHRRILKSKTYQQSSQQGLGELSEAQEVRRTYLYGRYPRRRLDAEVVRDSMLTLSRNLDRERGQGHPFPASNTWGFTQHSPFYAVYPSNKRSVYLMNQRLKRHPYLALFDGPDPNASTAVRTETTTPTQALYLMNSEFVHQQAKAFALHLIVSEGDQRRRIERAYLESFSRKPSSEEMDESLSFLSEFKEAFLELKKEPALKVEQEAWASFCRTLLTRNEFLFVD